MTDRQRRKLSNLGLKECISDDDQTFCPRLAERRKGRIHFPFGGCIQDLKLQPERASRCLQFFRLSVAIGISWVDEQSNFGGLWDHLVEHLQ
jgi:hypothetical protein